MAAYIAIFLSLVCIILMSIILIRFKKLFSTDAIIDKTKAQMNRVIMDVNNNANRDLELLNDSSRRLRALLNEADRKMESFREASQLLRNSIAEAERKTSAGSFKSVYAEGSKFQEKPRAPESSDKAQIIDPDASYRVRNIPPSSGGQRSLFDEDEAEPDNKSILKDETIVTNDGAAYKEVPLIITKVYDDKMALVKNQKDAQAAQIQKADRSLKEKVEKLFNQGMQIDDIAMELSCSTSEVQFIIDMCVNPLSAGEQ